MTLHTNTEIPLVSTSYEALFAKPNTPWLETARRSLARTENRAFIEVLFGNLNTHRCSYHS